MTTWEEDVDTQQHYKKIHLQRTIQQSSHQSINLTNSVFWVSKFTPHRSQQIATPSYKMWTAPSWDKPAQGTCRPPDSSSRQWANMAQIKLLQVMALDSTVQQYAFPLQRYLLIQRLKIYTATHLLLQHTCAQQMLNFGLPRLQSPHQLTFIWPRRSTMRATGRCQQVNSSFRTSASYSQRLLLWMAQGQTSVEIWSRQL
jgi:hypothetical protein